MQSRAFVTVEMDNKYCVVQWFRFEPQIPLENDQTGRETEDAEAILFH